MNRQIINVFYPADGAKILLRTERDWDQNVEPTRLDEGGAEFLIETDRPFFYFKPVLQRNGQPRWARGENFLAIATSDTPVDIYPYFSDEMHCSVCELMSPLPSGTGAEHRFRISAARLSREHAQALSGALHARRPESVSKRRSLPRKHLANRRRARGVGSDERH